MKLTDADELIANLTEWSLCELPEPNVNYIEGRMVTDHERQYEVYLILEEVIKETADQECVEAIPVEFIKEQIDKYYRLSAHSIPKVEKEYLAMAKHLRDLIGDWEMFGEKQNKGE